MSGNGAAGSAARVSRKRKTSTSQLRRYDLRPLPGHNTGAEATLATQQAPVRVTFLYLPLKGEVGAKGAGWGSLAQKSVWRLTPTTTLPLSGGGRSGAPPVTRESCDAVSLEHDAEKACPPGSTRRWIPVLGKDHALA